MAGKRRPGVVVAVFDASGEKLPPLPLSRDARCGRARADAREVVAPVGAPAALVAAPCTTRRTNQDGRVPLELVPLEPIGAEDDGAPPRGWILPAQAAALPLGLARHADPRRRVRPDVLADIAQALDEVFGLDWAQRDPALRPPFARPTRLHLRPGARFPSRRTGGGLRKV